MRQDIPRQFASTEIEIPEISRFCFFISLSFNETVLPNRQAQDADDVYAEGGRTQKKSGLVSAFNFLGEKRDDLMPSMTKQV